jgi:hypothetical protein
MGIHFAEILFNRRQGRYRASGLVYAREDVPFAGCKSLSELATAP